LGNAWSIASAVAFNTSRRPSFFANCTTLKLKKGISETYCGTVDRPNRLGYGVKRFNFVDKGTEIGRDDTSKHSKFLSHLTALLILTSDSRFGRLQRHGWPRS
jgi:hypothetical protein